MPRRNSRSRGQDKFNDITSFPKHFSTSNFGINVSLSFLCARRSFNAVGLLHARREKNIRNRLFTGCKVYIFVRNDGYFGEWILHAEINFVIFCLQTSLRNCSPVVYQCNKHINASYSLSCNVLISGIFLPSLGLFSLSLSLSFIIYQVHSHYRNVTKARKRAAIGRKSADLLL